MTEVTSVTPTSRASPTARGGRPKAVAHGAALILLVLAPLALSPFSTGTLGRILVFALLAASLDLLVGLTGLPSLAHAGYFATGAYTAGLMAQDVTTNGPVQIVAAVAMAAAVAAVSGAFVVRARGITFLMLTLAVGEIMFNLAESWSDVTGGSNGLFGLPSVTLLPGGGPLREIDHVYWYVLGGFVIGYGVCWLVASSPFGESLRGIGDNEARMRSIGYATYRYKLAAYAVAGAVAGGAGALWSAHQRLVTTADAGFNTAVLVLLAVVIGGVGSLWGPCLGAAVVILVRDNLGTTLEGKGPLILGLVFIAAVYVLPRGVAGVRLPVERLRMARSRAGP
jgi:branched-chain amino acid transport system permease protein